MFDLAIGLIIAAIVIGALPYILFALSFGSLFALAWLEELNAKYKRWRDG
jgi:alpha-beta hydrolase superfamily lysophospholipase